MKSLGNQSAFAAVFKMLADHPNENNLILQDSDSNNS